MSAALLFASEVLAGWLAAVYVPLPGQGRLGSSEERAVRSALGAVWVGCAAWSAKGVALAAVLALLAHVLQSGRRSAIERLRLAEWELGGVALVVVTIAAAAVLGLRVGFPYLAVPVPVAVLVIAHAGAAAVLLGTKASGYVVRGVLDKAGITATTGEARQGADVERRLVDVPAESAEGVVVVLEAAAPDMGLVEVGEQTVSPPVVTGREFRRGRIIGYLERLLVIVLVARGRFEALGFLVAAKGLIRARDLESRDFAEYFLIGTLVSVAIAVAIGLMLEQVLRALP